jgi:hypothetical protein
MIPAALLIATACRYHRPPEPQISLADCLAGERLGLTDRFLGDPHGQGSDLLGLGFMDARTFIRVDRFDVKSVADAAGSPVANVEIRSRTLTGVDDRTARPLEAEAWKGSVLVGQLHCSNPKLKGKTRNIKARIVEVVPDSTPLGPLERSLWVAYKLELELEDGRRFAQACRDAGDVAFPIPGYWNHAGDHVADPTKFSFACTRRHVATCLKQGYLDSSTSNDRMALLEACTRMMRADYCGNGESHTRDGTFISVWDNRNIAAEVHLEPLTFEAAWNRKGMICNARLRWGAHELPVPECLRAKPRPRCGSAKEAEALAPEQPLVFNDSCVEHPCRTRGVSEPFAGAPAPDPEPDPRDCPEAEARTAERAERAAAPRTSAK